MYDSSIQVSNPSTGRCPDQTRISPSWVGGGRNLGGRLSLALARGAQSEKPAFAPNAFIRIDAHGKVTLIMPQVEMGQGIYTAVAMILAEELDAAFDQVSLEAAPPNDKLYANPTFGLQVTGNSNSVRAFWLAPAQGGGRRTRHPGSSRCAAVEGGAVEHPHPEWRGHA